MSGKLVMPALRNFELVLEHPLDRECMKTCVEAVDELVEAAQFAAAALATGGAPTRTECDEMRAKFGAALAKFGGAA